MAIGTTTALALVAIAVSAAGTGVAIAGQVEQAAAAEKAGKYNEAVARNNATAAAQEAQFEAERIRKRNSIILGKQKAAIAKAGILDTGSTLDVFYDSAIEGELDAMAALYTGDVRSGYFRSQGQIARMEGDAAKRAGYYRAGSSLLTGVGGMGQQYYNYRQQSQTTRSGPTFED